MKHIVIFLIRIYQKFSGLGLPRCRFYPSCSQYACESVEAYGILRGIWLSLKRFIRCHPWGGSGYDPVPKG